MSWRIRSYNHTVARNELSETLMLALRPLQAAWKGLGLTPSTYSSGSTVLTCLI